MNLHVLRFLPYNQVSGRIRDYTAQPTILRLTEH